MRKLLLVLVFALAAPTLAHADDPAARKILQAVIDKNSAGFQTGQSKTTLTTQFASGNARTLETLARVIRNPAGLLRTRVTFLGPADFVGTELLIVDQSGGQAAQHLWLPKTKRLRRISGTALNEPFMGSDFSFGDLQGHGLQGGDAKKLGDEAVAGVACAKIEVTIKDDSDPYGRVLLWIDEKLAVPRRVQYFDKAGTLQKTLEVEKVRALDGGRAVLEKFSMTGHVRKSVTRVETRDIDTKATLPESLFVPEALGK